MEQLPQLWQLIGYEIGHPIPNQDLNTIDGYTFHYVPFIMSDEEEEMPCESHFVGILVSGSFQNTSLIPDIRVEDPTESQIRQYGHICQTFAIERHLFVESRDTRAVQPKVEPPPLPKLYTCVDMDLFK